MVAPICIPPAMSLVHGIAIAWSGGITRRSMDGAIVSAGDRAVPWHTYGRDAAVWIRRRRLAWSSMKPTTSAQRRRCPCPRPCASSGYQHGDPTGARSATYGQGSSHEIPHGRPGCLPLVCAPDVTESDRRCWGITHTRCCVRRCWNPPARRSSPGRARSCVLSGCYYKKIDHSVRDHVC